MRPKLVLCTLVSAAGLLAPSAHAGTFLFVGSEPATGITFTFSLDPSSATASNAGYLFAGVPASINGGPSFALDFNISPAQTSFFTGDLFQITGAGLDETYFLAANGPTDNPTLVLAGDPTVNPIPTINPGTYTGTDETGCVSSFRMPASPLRLFPTVAFFQAPVTTCGDFVSLVVTQTSPSVTPEPSTLALLGSGALGVFGVARRKFFS